MISLRIVEEENFRRLLFIFGKLSATPESIQNEQLNQSRQLTYAVGS